MLSGVRTTLAGLGNLVHRPALADGFTAFLRDLSRVQPSRRDWATGFGYAEVNWLADPACLLACCQAVGATRVGLAAGTAAYLVGMTASSLSVLPGGLGAVEGAMIVVFASSNVDLLTATAAVVLYRVISMVLVVAVGWVAFGLMRRSDKVRGVDDQGETAAEVQPAVTGQSVGLGSPAERTCRVATFRLGRAQMRRRSPRRCRAAGSTTEPSMTRIVTGEAGIPAHNVT
jgi:hypothetical protein